MIVLKPCVRCGDGAGSRVADVLSYCSSCIRQGDEFTLSELEMVHAGTRRKSGLPERVPEASGAPRCFICSRGCRPAPGEKGYCGLRENREGKLVHLAGMPSRGVLEYYFDPLPTNCVADWVCPVREEPYFGKKNLAVFYGACTLNCLFCQNWQHRSLAGRLYPGVSSAALAGNVDANTACICFFGGDPAPQVPHALNASRKALAQNPGLKICWETSGLISDVFFSKIMALASRSGGTIKFDLKAYNKHLYFALTGGDNGQVFKNFARCARFSREEKRTLAVASTLLVPGYITADEVYEIASFIAQYDPDTPYSLLGFYPHFQMKDLPLTSRTEAEACYRAAKRAGLRRVRLANEHLLR